MNTKSQSVVEIYHAHVPVSDSEATVATSKIQVFVKRFDRVSMAQWHAMTDWCYENLYHGGHYEPNWRHQYPTFYFTDPKEYTLFLLRWS